MVFNESGGGARFRGPGSSKKKSSEVSGIPHDGWGFLSRKAGREFRPNGHEGHNGNTSADDKGPLS